MATIQLQFATDPQLTGAAVNDSVYYIDSTVSNSTLNDVIYMGTIQAFTGSGPSWQIIVDTASLSFTMPTANDYVFFSKNNEVDMGSLLGYYAEVKLVNDSTEEAELFSLSLGVEKSSK